MEQQYPLLSEWLKKAQLKQKVQLDKINLKVRRGQRIWVWRDKQGRLIEAYGKNGNVDIFIRRNFNNAN